MSKPTPGPWIVGIHTVTETMRARMEEGTRHVAVCSGEDAEDPTGLLIALCGPYPDSASLADAHLISAAPDMFAALTEIMGMLERGELVRDISLDAQPDFALRMMEFVPKLNKAAMALAKAKGMT